MEQETPGKGKPLTLTADEAAQLAELLDGLDELSEVETLLLDRLSDALRAGAAIQVKKK